MVKILPATSGITNLVATIVFPIVAARCVAQYTLLICKSLTLQQLFLTWLVDRYLHIRGV